jgi:ribosomal protein S12 methylthiotransferase
MKVGFVSLGCPKNLVDSEVMMGLLDREGHRLTARPEDADVIVVNTCGFIDTAKQESIDSILEMAEYKKNGKCRKLIVTGCLVERYRTELVREIPEVDAVLGTNEIPRIVEACQTTNGAVRQKNLEATPTGYLYSDDTPRLVSTARYTAYIKIAEGCDHVCAFCMIPKMRGVFRSRPIESIVREAKRLAGQGTKEITLISQDTTNYGADIGLRDGLPKLLERLSQVRDIEWIRFLYNYPNTVTDALLEVVAGAPTICKYFDIPFQHASGRVLAAMRRGGNRSFLTRLVEKIRAKIPNVTMRTSMIVGFPGEAEADFEELLDFCKEIEFDRLGVFTYSDEEGSPAHTLAHKVSQRAKTQRRNQLLRQQAKISLAKNRQLVGRRLRVLVEGPSPETELLLSGRLESQAPEIDGAVLINDSAVDDVTVGDFRTVQITEAHEYDLIGKVV